jgi:hypothetical protein
MWLYESIMSTMGMMTQLYMESVRDAEKCQLDGCSHGVHELRGVLSEQDCIPWMEATTYEKIYPEVEPV